MGGGTTAYRLSTCVVAWGDPELMAGCNPFISSGREKEVGMHGLLR